MALENRLAQVYIKRNISSVEFSSLKVMDDNFLVHVYVYFMYI